MFQLGTHRAPHLEHIERRDDRTCPSTPQCNPLASTYTRVYTYIAYYIFTFVLNKIIFIHPQTTKQKQNNYDNNSNNNNYYNILIHVSHITMYGVPAPF